jgi:hypothetical protein
MKSRSIVTWGILAGVAACGVAVTAAGGGHGTYWAAKCRFPFTMVSTGWTAVITAPFIFLAVLQFPLYGFIIAFANARKRVVWAVWGLTAVHVAGVVLALMFSGSGFTP